MRKYWRAHFLNAELILAFALTAMIYAYGIIDKNFWTNTLLVNKDKFLTSLLPVLGSLLGFSIATVTFLLGINDHASLKILKRSPFYKTLWTTFTSTLKWLGTGTVLALIGILYHGWQPGVDFAIGANIGCFLVIVFRLGRCIWILENVIRIITVK
jgi:hypothetical protein